MGGRYRQQHRLQRDSSKKRHEQQRPQRGGAAATDAAASGARGEYFDVGQRLASRARHSASTKHVGDTVDVT